jgi:hypothetical protein
MEITQQEKYAKKVVGSYEEQNGVIEEAPRGNISDTTIEDSNMNGLTKEGKKENNQLGNTSTKSSLEN